TLVAQAKIRSERIATDVRTFCLAAACARAGVGVEVDLDLCIRRNDRPDVASFDDDVALVAELTLAFAHHLAHSRVFSDHGNLHVDVRLPNRGGDIGSGDRDASGLAELDRILRSELPEAFPLPQVAA